MHPQGPLRKSKEMQCRPRGPEKVNPFKVCLFFVGLYRNTNLDDLHVRYQTLYI